MEWLTSALAAGTPWIVAVAIWLLTKNDRDTFDRIVEQHDEDRDYWRARAVEAEARLSEAERKLRLHGLD